MVARSTTTKTASAPPPMKASAKPKTTRAAASRGKKAKAKRRRATMTARPAAAPLATSKSIIASKSLYPDIAKRHNVDVKTLAAIEADMWTSTLAQFKAGHRVRITRFGVVAVGFRPAAGDTTPRLQIDVTPAPQLLDLFQTETA